MKKVLRIIAGFLIFLLIFFLAGEAVCRVFVLSNDTFPVDFIEDPFLPYRYKPGSRTVSLHGIPININSLGLRDKECDQRKGEKAYRILVLGDSSTLGYGIRIEETFSERIEEILIRTDTASYEIINAGVSGYNTRDELNYLVHYGLDLHPDMVIMGLMTNDFTVRSLELDIKNGIGIGSGSNLRLSPAVKKILRRSKLYVFLAWARVEIRHRYKKRDFTKAEKTSDLGELWTSYSKVVDRLVSVCADNKMPLFIIAIPSREEVLRGEYDKQEFIEKMRLKARDRYVFIDMLPVFSNSRGPNNADNLYVKRDSCQPAPKGHKLIAEEIILNTEFQRYIRRV